MTTEEFDAFLKKIKERFATLATIGGVGAIALGIGLLLFDVDTVKNFIAAGLIIYGSYNTFAKK